MRVAIAGSSGMIGRALNETLTSRGHEVITLVRRPAKSVGEVTWNPEARTIDRHAPQLQSLDAIVNLCGVGIGDKRWTEQRKRDILSSRIDATSTLVDLLGALDQPPATFLSASAIGFYGDRGATELTEAAAKGHGFLAQVCVDWENAASNNIARTVILRTGVVLDPSGGALKKQLPHFRAGLGGKLGNGKQWLSWISLHDQVAAMVHLIEHRDLEGPVNLTAPKPVTNGAFTVALAAALNRPHLFSVPTIALGLALGRELTAEALAASQRVVPAKLIDTAAFTFAHPSLEVALASMLSR